MPVAAKPRSRSIDRRFGVEIECGVPGWQWNSLCEKVLCPPDFSKGWYGKTDGSGVEVCTPILQGKPGFKELRAAMGKLVELDGYVTIADGMHTHYDFPEKRQPGYVLALVEAWVENQDAIYQMVAPWRRKSSMCHAWTTHDVENLRNKEHPSRIGGGYKDFRFRYKTIEVRLHEGTLDADVAEAWIRFIQRFIHRVISKKPPKLDKKEAEALLTNLRIPSAYRMTMAEKIKAKHLTPLHRGLYRNKANGYSQGDPYEIAHDDNINSGLYD